MKKHKVRSHHWHNGSLEVRVAVFNTFEEALEFAKLLDCISAKIYNELEELLTEIFFNGPTYA